MQMLFIVIDSDLSDFGHERAQTLAIFIPGQLVCRAVKCVTSVDPADAELSHRGQSDIEIWLSAYEVLGYSRRLYATGVWLDLYCGGARNKSQLTPINRIAQRSEQDVDERLRRMGGVRHLRSIGRKKIPTPMRMFRAQTEGLVIVHH
jgi:hypothetical protein